MQLHGLPGATPSSCLRDLVPYRRTIHVFIESSLSFSSHYRSGVAFDGRWTSWNNRGRKQCNLVIFTQNSLDDCSEKRSNPSDCSE
ncbi:hypothetical protein F2Q68_00002316 [Brassica cretica]|uniref:Uncharacterized protein n=1 Tax=Brassica cretica TaxID=69181 RepID=A0A8S9JMQ0_BRACR|nr:hypothetical protein F2Q68_00002316 [Brassica cretica]